MNLKNFLSIILLFVGFISFGQINSEIEFSNYANKQDSLMRIAYQNLDTATYGKILDKFVLSYNKLDKKTQIAFEPLLSGVYYNFSCTYSLVGNNQKALEYLEKSKFNDYGHLLVDTDLDNIRKEKRFVDCLNYAKKYFLINLEILKKASEYNVNEKKIFPEFTYQSYKDTNLVKLRKLYKLDSIAGNGNEISKFINLMRWVHNNITHDGTNGNIEKLNALDLISTCKKENKTLNCRGLAIILNEIYLSMDFKSRFVTCLPKDSTDNDCHVINMVFSNTLQKWIWMDPTNEAYVMNENGELLSIEEVRERLINEKPLILNPDANWNHNSSRNKEDYLISYMAKNLYRFQCPINSEFDCETYKKGKVVKYCELIPLDYLGYKNIKKNKGNGVLIFTDFYSMNPNDFWSKPK